MNTILAFLIDGPALMSLFVASALILGAFLALRVLMLWYWKIDTIIQNQEMQKQILIKILESIRSNPDAFSIEDKARLKEERRV